MVTNIRQRIWRENGLSIVLATLFVVFVVGQALTGWQSYNQGKIEHWQAPVSLTAYLQTGAFGEAIFENWESEFLQMALYVILTAFLFQKGSSESKDPHASEEKEKVSQDSPWPVRKGGWILKIYNHSLALAFAALFFISFVGHAILGQRAFNEEALEHGQPIETVFGYMSSAQFWFESLQNWQSEFLAIFAIVVLSIWLREKGSPESKRVSAPHGETG